MVSSPLALTNLTAGAIRLVSASRRAASAWSADSTLRVASSAAAEAWAEAATSGFQGSDQLLQVHRLACQLLRLLVFGREIGVHLLARACLLATMKSMRACSSPKLV
jgi:hypothetical protein